MRIFLRVMSCFVVAAVLVPAAVTAQDHKAPVARLKLEDGDSLVFLGDSITHQCLYTQYVEDYYYTRFPGLRIKFHNAGVGGAKASDALARFDRDVAAYKPKYVTILLGMNDGTYRPYDGPTFKTYRKDMLEVVAKIRATGAAPILMTPTMFDSRAARLRARGKSVESPRLEFYNSTLAYYGAWLREIAVEAGDGFVDMYGPLNNLTLQQRKTEPNFTMIADSVHPGPAGQIVMAYAILEDMGARRLVSNVRITKRGRKEPAAKVTGGEVSDVAFTDEGVSFEWAAESLPWVLPEDAAVGVKLLKLPHRMSREALEIHGLGAGRYELSIDGEVVGTYSNTALARHVELQQNAKTPQYQQAAEVAALNQKRNAGPVRGLRGEWSQFQRYDRLKQRSKGAPDNAELAAQVKSLEEKLEGMEERIAKHEKAAKEIEDQIFQVNQPKPRKYVLKRVRPQKS